MQALKTTITSDNKASWGLFSSLARKRGGELSHEPYFRKDAHFDGKHATEHMVTIQFAEGASDDVSGNWMSLRKADEARSDDAA